MTTKLDFQTVKNLKKPGRYTDALVRGLHIWVKPNLTKYWIYRFTQEGKQRNTSLGSFPALSISDARLKAEKLRERVSNGENPIAIKQEVQILAKAPKAKKLLFKDFALACIETKRAEWSNQKHGDQWVATLKEYAFPVIGEMPIDEVTMNRYHFSRHFLA